MGEGGGPCTVIAAWASIHTRRRWGEGGPIAASPPLIDLSHIAVAARRRWGEGGPIATTAPAQPTVTTAPAAAIETDAEDPLTCRLQDSGTDRER
jgi:hypothetical protein